MLGEDVEEAAAAVVATDHAQLGSAKPGQGGGGGGGDGDGGGDCAVEMGEAADANKTEKEASKEKAQEDNEKSEEKMTVISFTTVPDLPPKKGAEEGEKAAIEAPRFGRLLLWFIPVIIIIGGTFLVVLLLAHYGGQNDESTDILDGGNHYFGMIGGHRIDTGPRRDKDCNKQDQTSHERNDDDDNHDRDSHERDEADHGHDQHDSHGDSDDDDYDRDRRDAPPMSADVDDDEGDDIDGSHEEVPAMPAEVDDIKYADKDKEEVLIPADWYINCEFIGLPSVDGWIDPPADLADGRGGFPESWEENLSGMSRGSFELQRRKPCPPGMRWVGDDQLLDGVPMFDEAAWFGETPRFGEERMFDEERMFGDAAGKEHFPYRTRFRRRRA